MRGRGMARRRSRLLRSDLKAAKVAASLLWAGILLENDFRALVLMTGEKKYSVSDFFSRFSGCASKYSLMATAGKASGIPKLKRTSVQKKAEPHSCFG